MNQTLVKDYSENQSNIQIHTNCGDFTSSKLIFATNGFSKNIINTNVIPARGQVLITKPIKNLNIMRVLVTGGAGYIGSHTSLSLLLSGFRVIILDSNINSHQNSLKRIMKIGNDKYLDFEERLFFAKGDIRDERLLDNIFKKANKKLVIIKNGDHSLSDTKSLKKMKSELSRIIKNIS